MFTYRKNGSDKGKCILKHKIPLIGNDDTIFKQNSDVDTYMRLPLGYKYDKNLKYSDSTPNTFVDRTTQTVMECANECDININSKGKITDCVGFNYNTRNGKCQLYYGLNNQKESSSHIHSFTLKNKIYRAKLDNPDTADTTNVSTTGHLCKWTDHIGKIRKNISKDRNELNISKYKEIQKIENDQDNEIFNLQATVTKDAKIKTLNMMMNPKSLITWTNINQKCNAVEIKLLRTDYLQIAYIMIIGIVDDQEGNKSKTNILRTRTHFDSFDGSSEKLDDDSYFNLIKDSDYYSETIATNAYENCTANPDLEKFYSSKYMKNPKIQLNFIEEIEIEKIFIYNRLDSHQEQLVPLKISLKNNSGVILRQAIKNNFKESLQLSKPPPKIPGELGIDSYNDSMFKPLVGDAQHDLGNEHMIREWVDLDGIDSNNTYCSISNMKITSEQPDSTTNNVYKNTTIEKKYPHLRCVKKNPSNQTNIPSILIDPGYSKTQFFDKIENTLNFCRCKGNPPNTYVGCIPFDKQNNIWKNENEYIPRNKPQGCQNIDGDTLKEMGKVDIKKCKDVMIDNTNNTNNTNKQPEKNISLYQLYKDIHDNIINAGFYHVHRHVLYLFKNTKLNNKSIVLFLKLKLSTPPNSGRVQILQRGILNNTTKSFSGLDNPMFYTKIDASCYYDKTRILLFSDNQYILYNITTKKKESHGTINNLWKRIPNYFTRNLTAVLNKSSNSNTKIKIFWLFKNDKFVEIIIKDNDHTKMESNSVQYINDFIHAELNKAKSNIHTKTKYITYIDSALIVKKGNSEILYLFNKDKNIQIDLNAHKINQIGAKNKILNNGSNLWSFNIGKDF